MAGLMLPAAGADQRTTPAAAPATINQRKENQQDRIANGIQERPADRGRNQESGKEGIRR